MNKWYLSVACVACYGWTGGNAITGYTADSATQGNDAFIPEMWANEGLTILEENMVMANLVSRDFDANVANYGDVVNTRRAGTFTITRKADGDSLVPETAAATNVPVRLDQWFYKNFVIKDGEASLSFQDLVDIYLVPAMQVIGRSVDRAIMGRVHAFLGGVNDRAGKLQGLTSSTSYDDVLEARQRLNENLARMTGRNLVLSPSAETAMLKNTMFVKANERGDGGTALENAALGRIAGFNTYLDQNVNSYLTGGEVLDITVSSGAHPAGYAGALSLTSAETALAGEFICIPQNGQPTWVVTLDAGATPDTVVLNEALKYGIDDDEPAVRYLACDVTGTGSDYPANYSKSMLLTHGDGLGPQVGQLLAFGVTPSTRYTYTIIEAVAASGTTTYVTLDRPLEAIVARGSNNAFPGPKGSFNWAFHRDAIALVSRPLALPNSQMGVLTKVGVHNGLSMRVAMQYDIDAGGTKVNLDLLCGVAVLDSRLCVPLLG